MIIEEVVDQFKFNLRGKLIQPNDPQCNEACKLYNGMIDKHPGYIVKPM